MNDNPQPLNTGHDEPDEHFFYGDDEFIACDFCPACGNDYDEIDFEYQICHLCKFNNNQK